MPKTILILSLLGISAYYIHCSTYRYHPQCSPSSVCNLRYVEQSEIALLGFHTYVLHFKYHPAPDVEWVHIHVYV